MPRFIIQSVEGNHQRLDGGAMFGNVPRALWQTWVEPDAKNRIELACRAFLVRDLLRRRLILLEAGIGVFFEPRLMDRFGVIESGHRLLMSLAELDVEPEQIDLVVLSHLHFDHAGGLLTPWRPDGAHELVFPRARLLVSRPAWERATRPHARDRASFVPALLSLMEASGRLELSSGPSSELLGEGFSLSYAQGHTPGMMLTHLATPAGSAVFCGDLVPGRPWIHLPVTMGYDRFPERLIEEKAELLDACLAQGTWLLLTHDAACAACRVSRDEHGRFGPADEQAMLKGLVL